MSSPRPAAPRPAHPAPAASRLTLAAGWSLLAICLLHTLAFSMHPYWADWLAGPFRDTTAVADESIQFWGLPGGFVVPGALLGLQILERGRQGLRLPAYVGGVLAVWALACLWVIGPSGFLVVLVPAGLLLAARLRAEVTAPGAAARRRSPAER
ncbi:DUF6463 family protein [Brachybacterium sp.]|uniref:DUF6463 family protein n=1 Tax=Brachybacterium sp. TaxID=1891286 RepID=UPI002ED23DC2